jgi:hypothetical protein
MVFVRILLQTVSKEHAGALKYKRRDIIHVRINIVKAK